MGEIMRTMRQAIAHARKLWGNTAAVRDNGIKFTIPQSERDEAKAQWHAFKQQRDKSTDRAESRSFQKQMDGLFWKIHGHRYSVGKIMMGMFFEVRGDGDSWDDAFAEAVRKYPSLNKSA